VGEAIAYLSQFVTLRAGDLFMTGTPAGVGAVVKGDVLEGKIEGVGTVKTSVI
jgi:fumarylpyruvate hydrolase